MGYCRLDVIPEFLNLRSCWLGSCCILLENYQFSLFPSKWLGIMCRCVLGLAVSLLRIMNEYKMFRLQIVGSSLISLCWSLWFPFNILLPLTCWLKGFLSVCSASFARTTTQHTSFTNSIPTFLYSKAFSASVFVNCDFTSNYHIHINFEYRKISTNCCVFFIDAVAYSMYAFITRFATYLNKSYIDNVILFILFYFVEM